MQEDLQFDQEGFLRWEPVLRFLFQGYFDVKVVGMENIPANGRAVLSGNHSGVLPIDATMLLEAMYLLHRQKRMIRFLALKWFFGIKGVSSTLREGGAVPASMDNALELLRKDELVFIYPEGEKGTSKPFSERYKMVEFDPGFVKAALITQSPIIPVMTVGFDEIYPLLSPGHKLAKLMGFPYFPLTMTFPWLPICSSIVPLPVKILIKIGEPLKLDFPPEKADDEEFCQELAEQIQEALQRELDFLLSKRKHPFADWNLEEIRAMN